MVLVKQWLAFLFTLTFTLATLLLSIFFINPFLSSEIHPLVPVVQLVSGFFTIMLLTMTKLSDPGVIPLPTADEVAATKARRRDVVKASPVKDVIEHLEVRGHRVKVKFCRTCLFFRPPRASHCGVCNVCIEEYDHHCPWVGNCIGKRNYRIFFFFLMAMAVFINYSLGCAIAHLILYWQDTDWLTTASDCWPSVVVVFIGFFVFWPMHSLAGFHVYLAMINQTTNEYWKRLFIDPQTKVVKNPYSTTCWDNWTTRLCGPANYRFYCNNLERLSRVKLEDALLTAKV